MKLSIFLEQIPDEGIAWWQNLASGLGWTLGTAFFAWIIAFTLGSIVGVVRTTDKHWLVRIGNAYVELFRNIPLIVQFFVWYFVVPNVIPAVKAWVIAAGPDRISVRHFHRLPRPVHLGAHRRAGALGHPVAVARPAQRRLRHRPDPAADLPLCAAADGLPHHHPAAYLGGDEPDQEHLGGLFDRPGRTVLPHARNGRDDVPLFRGLRCGDADLHGDRDSPPTASWPSSSGAWPSPATSPAASRWAISTSTSSAVPCPI